MPLCGAVHHQEQRSTLVGFHHLMGLHHCTGQQGDGLTPLQLPTFLRGGGKGGEGRGGGGGEGYPGGQCVCVCVGDSIEGPSTAMDDIEDLSPSTLNPLTIPLGTSRASARLGSNFPGMSFISST